MTQTETGGHWLRTNAKAKTLSRAGVGSPECLDGLSEGIKVLNITPADAGVTQKCTFKLSHGHLGHMVPVFRVHLFPFFIY